MSIVPQAIALPVESSNDDQRPNSHVLTPNSVVPEPVIRMVEKGDAFTSETFTGLQHLGCAPSDIGHFARSSGVPGGQFFRAVVPFAQEVRLEALTSYRARTVDRAIRSVQAGSIERQEALTPLVGGELGLQVRLVLDAVAANRGEISLDPNDVAPFKDLIKTTDIPLRSIERALLFRGAEQKQVDRLMYFLARAWDDDERKSDTGSARRLVALFGDDIRFSPSRGWLIWDGARWRHDELGDLPELAKLVARAWRDDADLIARTAAFAQSDAELEAILGRSAGLAGWARSCESKTRLQSMLKVAETMPGVALAAARLDARPWLLNVANGTLDLRSAELRPHSREDLLTVVVPVEYRPGARLQLWDNFLASATGGDSDLQDFMQRAAGYSLTGYTGEEVLFFVYGPAGSGKSTFVEAMRSVLGTYARSADFESFIKKTGGRGIPNDIAALSAARLVAAIEVDAGKEMAAAVVKQLTGGDTVTARFLFNEFFEFKPEFKLWLVANDAPVIDASDSGLARRIRVVPLTNAVPGDDQVSWVKDLLTSPLAGPAILAWMVEGCLKFQSDGLGSAAAVDRANAEYSESMDDVGHFIEECCLVESGHFTSTADLFQVYRAWANGNGMTILTGNALGRTLTKKGFVKGKKRDKRGWSGLGLRPVSVDIQWDGYRDVSNPPVMPALPSG